MRTFLKILKPFAEISKKAFSIILVAAVLSSQLFYTPLAYAATYNFTQSSWAGGATANNAAHGSNQTGWTELTSTTTASAGTTVTLPTASYGFTDDGATSTTQVVPAYGGIFSNGASTAAYTFTDDGATSTSPTASTYGGGFNSASAATSSAITTGTGASASVGLVITAGGAITTFTSSGTYTVPSDVSSVKVLVVGGGGGGSPISTQYNVGTGGGGGGGVLYNANYAVTAGNVLTVTVGAGGSGATPSSGSNSVFDTLTATGGGKGGTWNGTPATGGSGGGGASGISGAAGTSGQGSTGGNGVSTSGGGGGGAGAVGSNSSGGTGGAGGAGTANSISGSSVTYGGGGGGGGSSAGGAGGSGGGGAGRSGIDGVAGTINTGGGGGGTGRPGSGSSSNGGAGGKGIVIVSTNASYATSGTFASAIIDTNTSATFSTLSFATTTPANTNVTIKVRSSNSSSMSGATAWGSCTNVANGGAVSTGGCVTDGHRYVQYQATLTTSDTSITPTLDSVVIGYSGSVANNISGSDTAASVKLFYSGVYSTAGTFTSAVLDLGVASGLATLSYTKTTPANTALTMDIRAGNTATPDGTWTSYTTGVASGGSISALGSKRYVQYRANLSTTDTAATPTLDTVTVNYTQYLLGGNMVSSKYDAGSDTNVISKLSWTGSATSSSETIKFQVRSSADGATWSNWCGPSATCDGTDYFTDTDNGVALVSNHPFRADNNDRWVQYKAYLVSGGGVTPVLNSTIVQYVVNAPPEFDATYGTNGVFPTQISNSASSDWGKVTIGYRLRDTDTTGGAFTANLITPSFEYSTTSGSYWAPIPSGDLAIGDTDNKTVEESNYNTYVATWTATSTLPSIYNTTMKVRVTANDNEAANNTATAVSAVFTLDTLAPVAGNGNAILNASTTPEAVVLTATDGSQLQYRICNDSAFPSTDTQGNSCAWSSLSGNLASTSVVWTTTGAPSSQTTYLQVRDAYSNLVSRTLTAPATPVNFIFADVSNPAANSYGEYMSWATVAGASVYKLYYTSTTASAAAPSFSSYSLLSTTATNNYAHSIAENTTLKYWYKIVAISSNGDVSNFADVVGDVPDSYGTSLPDTVAPVVSNIATSSVLSTGATVTFTTDKLATSTILYGTTHSDSCAYNSRLSTSAYATSQSSTLSGLTASTVYYFCISTTDTTGNTSTATSTTDTGVPLAFTTAAATVMPLITNIATSSVSSAAFLVSWNVSTSSDSYILYSTSPSLTDPLTVGSATLVASTSQHQVTITGLSASTSYYFSVRSTDGSGNTTTDTNTGSYYNVNTSAATTDAAPIVSAIATSSVLSTSALVTFTTDKIATSTVLYGTSYGSCSSYSSMLSTEAYTTSQSISLSSLTANTSYYFCVKTTNTSGYTSIATSTTDTGVPLAFTTAAATVMPVITSVATSSVNNTAFTVSWNTSTSSDSYVSYSSSPSLTNPLTVGSVTLVSESSPGVYPHQVNVTALSPGVNYYFSVRSTDGSGNSTTDTNSSSYYNVLTTVEAAPVISSIATSSVLSNSIVITFTTDELASSTILYGTTYSDSCAYGSRLSTNAYATSHSVTLTSLTAGTAYYFCVETTDVYGVTGTAVSGGSFSTTAGPAITNVHLGTMTDTTAVVLWDTATSSDSYVYYSTNSSLTNPLNAGGATSTQNGEIYNHEVSLTGLTLGVPYYYYVKSTDSSGNSSTDTNSGSYYTIAASRDAVAPVITNLTAPIKSTTSAAVVWQTDENATSHVFYGLSSGVYTGVTSRDTTKSIYHVAALSSTTLNTYLGATDVSVSNNSLTPNTTYYFVVVSTDAAGNTATSSESTFTTIASVTDVTQPSVSSISVPSATLKSTSAIITFVTDEVATSTVQYKVSGASSWTIVESTAYDISHSVTLSGLSANTTYRLQVRAGDAVGNTSDYVAAADFTTTGGPIISGVTSGSPSDTTATISWNTSTSSDSYVYYSTSASMVNPLTAGNATMVVESGTPGVFAHQVILSGLSTNTKYYYYVKSTDSNADSTIANNTDAYYDFTTTSDTTAPVISAISAPVRSSAAAVITWKTDELATSQVEYGTTASTTAGTYEVTTVLNSTPSIFHVVTLSSETENISGGTNTLVKNTTYYYRVRSVNAVGAPSVSDENSFITNEDGATVIISGGGGGGSYNPPVDRTPPVISGVKIDPVTPFGVTVTFTTDKESIGLITYGETTAYGSSVGDPVYSSSHPVVIKGLHIGTNYHFKITAIDHNGNLVSSEDKTFKTDMLAQDLGNLKLLDTASSEDIQSKIDDLVESALPSLNPPFIETPEVTDITENSATITWKTNVKSFGSVVYAADSEYSKDSYVGENTEAGSARKTFHSVTLSNLQSNSKYHYSVKSYVFQQVSGQTGDFTFVTQAAKVQAQIQDKKKDSFHVTWTTDGPSSSIVEYRKVGASSFNKMTDETLSTYHDMLVKNLTPATTYEVKAYGLTKDGNPVEVKENIKVTTSQDVTPPQITNFKVDSTLIPSRSDRIQTVVSWKTDEPATSVVSYEEGSGSISAELSNKKEEKDTLLENHTIILTTLKPGTIYRFQISSSDDAGNTTTFPISTVVTPKQNQSIVDVIFKNFGDTFNFIK